MGQKVMLPYSSCHQTRTYLEITRSTKDKMARLGQETNQQASHETRLRRGYIRWKRLRIQKDKGVFWDSDGWMELKGKELARENYVW